jgi:hypothetical protein
MKTALRMPSLVRGLPLLAIIGTFGLRSQVPPKEPLVPTYVANSGVLVGSGMPKCSSTPSSTSRIRNTGPPLPRFSTRS